MQPTTPLFSRPLPAWLETLINSPPVAGAGVHSWLYRAACKLLPWRSEADIVRMLAASAERCGRAVPAREILDAVKNAENDWAPDGHPSGTRAMIAGTPALASLLPERAARWPKPDWQRISAIAETGAGVVDLWENSPERLEGAYDANEVLSWLFPGNPLLCMAREKPMEAFTAPRSSWNATDFALVVPSAMSALTGKRQDGEESQRCLDNTGARCFLVVEFDFKADGEAGPVLARMAAERNPRGPLDLCAAILLHLAGMGAPLVMAVYSGGKSIHGWFPAHHTDDDALRPFFADCCTLGADPMTWTRCQLVRVAEGRRDNGRRQSIKYLNPKFLPNHNQ